MEDFHIAGLDHIAIRVADIQASTRWYEKALGLKKYKVEKWGEFPLFLLAGKTGVALFPAELTEHKISKNSKNIGFDHFAFNVTKMNYEKAKSRFKSLGIHFTEKDHHYFHSIYTTDPDGYTVELTTLVVEEDEFY